MSSIRRLRTALCLTALAACLAACGSNPSGANSTDGSDPGSAEGKVVAFIGYGKPNPWATAFNDVYLADIENAGVEVRDMSTLESATQVQNFNQAIAMKADLIVFAALDAKALVAPIQKAKAAGIPMLAYDTEVEPSVADDVMSVLTDNEKLGEFAAQNIVSGLEAQGKDSGKIIALIGFASQGTTQDRIDGFEKVLAEHPGYEVLEYVDTNWDPNKSGQAALQLLAKYGEDGVQAAWGMADYMATPIVAAARQLGIPVGATSGLLVVGSNCAKVGIDAIKDGSMYGTGTDDPSTIAKQAAVYTVDFFEGKKHEQTEYVVEERITPDNVDQFAEQCSTF